MQARQNRLSDIKQYRVETLRITVRTPTISTKVNRNIPRTNVYNPTLFPFFDPN